MQKLSGKAAVITGGGSGIGLATAKLFAEHGARLLLVGRDEAHLLRAQEDIPGASVLRADFARMDDLSRLADAAGARLGSVDVLFVNAGASRPMPSRSRGRFASTCRLLDRRARPSKRSPREEKFPSPAPS